jgi:hypothetical protein
MTDMQDKALTYAAACTTAAGGILHLIMSYNVASFNTNMFMFFLMSGIAQLFWILPVMREWRIAWKCVGIAGTGILVAMWIVTRLPNPITGQAFPTNAIGVATQAAQLVFIGVLAVKIFTERRKISKDTKVT